MDKSEKIGPSPYMRLLGVEVEEADYPHIRVAMKFNKQLTNPNGTFHGGVISSLVDIALGSALFQDQSIRGIATMELKVNYLQGITEGKVTVEGEIIHRKNHLAFGEVYIYNDGVLAAVGSATYRLTEQQDKK